MCQSGLPASRTSTLRTAVAPAESSIFRTRAAPKAFWIATGVDVAQMALAVLSERFGAYVTGETIAVDGGIALHNWIEPRG